MVFERAYCTFSGVATVNLWGGKLEGHVFIVEVVDECFGALVVQFLEAGAETSGDEKFVSALVSQQYLVPRFCGHGLTVNAVAVVVVQHQHLCVARRTFDGKASGLVCEDLTVCRDAPGEKVVGSGALS